MTSNEATIHRFYECLERNAAAGMADCYDDDASFLDMAFRLQGKALIAAMWRFECSRGLNVVYRDIRTEGSEVRGHWDCDYMFKGKWPIHNEIDSTFSFRDGKILRHVDKASRWIWARPAHGFPGDVVVTVFPLALRLNRRDG